MQQAPATKDILQLTSAQFAAYVPGGRFEWHTRDGAVFVVRPHRGSAIAFKIGTASAPRMAEGIAKAFVKGYAFARGDSNEAAAE